MSWPTMGRSEPCRARCVVICLVAMLACSLAACAADKEQPGPATTSDLVVDLQSLQPSEGGLSPSFHPADQSYAVNVGPNTSTVTLTAVTTDPRANLKINNQSATSGQPFGPIPLNGLTTTIPIVVEAFGVTKDYQVTVTRQTTPDLQNLTASAGALSPAFAPATLAYTVTTGFSTASTTITATVADNTATLTINGSPVTSGVASSPIALNPGSTIIPVEVTASNGRKKTYQVTVVRGNTADLANLQTSAGPIAPVFSPSVQNYTASTGFTTTQATITVTPADSTATITINNQAAQNGQAVGPFNLNVGSNTFTIVATAGSAGSKTYTLVITRTPADTDANLTNLSVSAGALNPGFDPTITNYVVNAPNSTTSTTVTATVAQSTSSLTINNNPATSGQAAGPFSLNIGANVFTVVVTAQSGATRAYQVTIIRSDPSCSATLTNLTVSPGSIAFNPGIQSYTVNVGDTVGSVTVSATPQASTTVTINGQVTTSRSVTLNPPGTATTITVAVQCPDGSTTTYTITVNRANPACNPNLGNLTLSAGSISFTPSQTTYAITVRNSTASTTVTATLPAGSTSTLRINNQQVTSGQTVTVPLPIVGLNAISVVVTCADGSSRPYTVTVTRQGDATLKNLEIPTPGCEFFCANILQPAFSPTRFSYAATVSSSIGAVDVRATKNNASQVVTINKQVTTDRTIFLNAIGTPTLITVDVTASDGVTKEAYTVTVSRNSADLASLVVRPPGSGPGCNAAFTKPYALDPEFSASQLNYRVNVGVVPVVSVCVAAGPVDPNAIVKINGQTGTLRQITLNTTINTTLVGIEVTAPNLAPKSYTVTVFQDSVD